MQRFIDIASFPESLSFYICVFDSLAACEVDYVQFSLFGLDYVLLNSFAFDEDTEDSMRPGAFGVH